MKFQKEYFCIAIQNADMPLMIVFLSIIVIKFKTLNQILTYMKNWRLVLSLLLPWATMITILKLGHLIFSAVLNFFARKCSCLSHDIVAHL